jgi:hypothetical protein
MRGEEGIRSTMIYGVGMDPNAGRMMSQSAGYYAYEGESSVARGLGHASGRLSPSRKLIGSLRLLELDAPILIWTNFLVICSLPFIREHLVHNNLPMMYRNHEYLTTGVK